MNVNILANTIPLTTGQMFGWLFLSVVVLKHIISKRNEPLPWHKITIKITSVLLNGHVCNSFILFLFQISTLFMLINFLSIRNERVFRIKNVKTIFSSFYSDWLNLLLKNLKSKREEWLIGGLLAQLKTKTINKKRQFQMCNI